MVQPNQACFFNIVSKVNSTDGGTKGAFQINEQTGNLGLMLIEGEWNVTTTQLGSKFAHSLPSSASG